ncbi:FliM/FliN family flagellar motor switch protein [Cupriavidus pampae]|uniref:Flagellar motor switch protein FliN-like C-terminal domain-containing protein n=1 Tax=Cupriavidus pampae TaxID=659251 RepID=A0ABM8WHQ1_9BURK|nr:FliM/FliN family flagellar motor switch protein [Cupriavidus pampae]CAG9166928.1 hypothetical protein LMG32289_01234 [Cupriavidus pampae]
MSAHPSVHIDSLRARLPHHAPALARLSRALPAIARQARLDATLLVSAREPVMVLPACATIASDAGDAVLRFDLASSPALESIAADRDDARRVALANLYLAPWLAALQPAHTGALVVRDIGVATRSGDGRGLSLTFGTDAPCVIDAIDLSLVEALERSLDASPLRADAPAGRLAGRLQIATRMLRLDTLRGLRVGDVLLGWPLRALFMSGAPLHGLSLRWGSAQGVQAHATVSVDGSTLTLESPLTMTHDTQDFAVEIAPELEVPEHDAPQDLAALDLGPMTVPVRVELVTLELSLDAIAALHAGSIVELPAPLDGAIVQLVCCGNTVASGQLVAVGDNLGVRIVHQIDGR